MVQSDQGRVSKISVAVVLLSCLWFVSEAFPCTLFGAIGNGVEGGGALMAKTRDQVKDLEQVWIEVLPKEGYRYRGIASKGTKRVTSGINEKGLVVLSAAASHVEKGGKITPVGEILSKASSVSEVISLVQEGEIQGAVYYLVGDIRKIAILEVVDNYRFGFLIQENGVLFHTNHFILKDMGKLDRKIGRSSKARLNRIEGLLGKGSLTKDKFKAFAQDHFNGPGDNSICRHFESGIPSSEQTVSAAVYYLSKKGAPEIWVNLGQPCRRIWSSRQFIMGKLELGLRDMITFLYAHRYSVASGFSGPQPSL